MTDDFAKKTAKDLAKDLFHGMSILVTTGTGVKDAFMLCVPPAIQASYERQGQLTVALGKLLAAPGDHMTACDRTMGASHPCTCGANEAREMLAAGPAAATAHDEQR